MRVIFATTASYLLGSGGGASDATAHFVPVLKKLGVDCRVVMPMNNKIMHKFGNYVQFVSNFSVQVAWRVQQCMVYCVELDGIGHYIISNPYYFDEYDSITDLYNDPAKYIEASAFFSRAVLEMLKVNGYKPDIIYTNDMDTALIPVF